MMDRQSAVFESKRVHVLWVIDDTLPVAGCPESALHRCPQQPAAHEGMDVAPVWKMAGSSARLLTTGFVDMECGTLDRDEVGHSNEIIRGDGKDMIRVMSQEDADRIVAPSVHRCSIAQRSSIHSGQVSAIQRNHVRTHLVRCASAN